jgi:hypothetical protein
MIVRMVTSSANRTATLATLFQTELAVFAAQGKRPQPDTRLTPAREAAMMAFAKSWRRE